jgi:hypothetical protein
MNNPTSEQIFHSCWIQLDKNLKEKGCHRLLHPISLKNQSIFNLLVRSMHIRNHIKEENEKVV